MENNEVEDVQTPELDEQEEEEVEEEPEEVVEDEESQVDVDSVLEENEQLKKDLADRDEKLKKDRIKARKANKEPSKDNLSEISTRDAISLVKEDITEDEDINVALDYAKLKKIPLSTALKSNTLKAILRENQEQRKVSEATDTGGSRRSSSKVSDEALLDRASSGKEVKDTDIVRLVKARKGLT